MNSRLSSVFYMKILFNCLKNFQISPRMPWFSRCVYIIQTWGEIYVYACVYMSAYRHVNIWGLIVILTDNLFLSFKEICSCYMLTHLEFYAIRNQTWGEGLFLTSGSLEPLHASHLREFKDCIGRQRGWMVFSLEGIGISGVSACCCWAVRVGGTVQ